MNTRPFKDDPQGTEAVIITLANKNGMRAELTNYGATVVGITCPDREGNMADVCLGYDTLKEYQTRKGYLGATVGRVCNRIADASFEMDGIHYQLYANDGSNTLHGGRTGFSHRVFEYDQPDDQSAVMRYTSEDFEEGFPGKLDLTVRFSLGDDGGLQIEYEASSDRDTVVNLTNHSYFNLAGEGLIHDHTLQINADQVLEVKPDLIPTGRSLDVKDTPYDLRTPRKLGDVLAVRGVSEMFDGAKGFDAGYVTRGEGYREVGVLVHPASGRRMRVLSDEPGIQVYSGQGLNMPGKNGQQYQPYSGIALETQHHPDSVHHPDFPSTRLSAGHVYHSKTAYVFDTV